MLRYLKSVSFLLFLVSYTGKILMGCTIRAVVICEILAHLEGWLNTGLGADARHVLAGYSHSQGPGTGLQCIVV